MADEDPRQERIPEDELLEMTRQIGELHQALKDLVDPLPVAHLGLIAESAFRPETRRWAADLVNPILRTGSLLIAERDGFRQVSQAPSFDAFQSEVNLALAPLSFWLIDPSNLLADTTSQAIREAVDFVARVKSQQSLISKELTDLASLKYAESIHTQAAREDVKARFWLIATTLLTLGSFIVGLWAINGLSVGPVDWDRPDLKGVE